MRRIISIASRAVVSGTLLIGLAACGSGVQFVRQDMTEYPPKPKDAVVEILNGGTMQPHVVIGSLTASKKMKASFNDESTYDQVLKELKVHARKVGADALINVRPVTGDSGLDTKVAVTATAIRYLQERATISSKDS